MPEPTSAAERLANRLAQLSEYKLPGAFFNVDDVRQVLAERKELYRIKPLVWWHKRDGDDYTAGADVWSLRVDGERIGTSGESWRWRYCIDEFYHEGGGDAESLEDGIAKAEAWYRAEVEQYLIPALNPQ